MLFFFLFFGKMEQMLKSLYSNQQIKQNPVPTQTPRPQIQSKQSQQHISTHTAQKLNFNQCPIQPNTKISYLCANSIKSRTTNIQNKTTIKISKREREILAIYNLCYWPKCEEAVVGCGFEWWGMVWLSNERVRDF